MQNPVKAGSLFRFGIGGSSVAMRCPASFSPSNKVFPWSRSEMLRRSVQYFFFFNKLLCHLSPSFC